MAGILSQTVPLQWYWFLSLTLIKAADLDTLKKQGFILAHGFRVRVESMAENNSHQQKKKYTCRKRCSLPPSVTII